MSRNIRSLVLFFILLSGVLFLAGFRYGKYVERADKSYIPPSPTLPPITLSPSQKPFAIVSYNGKICNVSFLYPNYMEEQSISSQEAKLSKNMETIYISCDKITVRRIKDERKTASSSATITVLNQSVPIYKNNSLSSIIVFNPYSNQSILIETTNNLVKLIFPSLEFGK